VITPDGTFVRIEGDVIVTRDLGTGNVIGSTPAPSASGLCLAPWGDLLYSQADPDGNSALQCVTRAGRYRWSVPIKDPAPLIYEPFPLGDVVVAERSGALWAFDRNGETPWLADLDGVHPGHPAHTVPRAAAGLGPAVTLRAAPARLDENRAIVELSWHSGRGLYLLDGAKARLTPVAVPSPARRPYTVLRRSPDDYRIAGLGSQVEVGHLRWEHPVVAIGPTGAPAWEHRLETQATALTPAPDGSVIVAASPTAQRWNDYRHWYDLTAEMFIRCLDFEGTQRWVWHPPAPVLHRPVVSQDGTVYIGSDNRLWAFSTGIRPT
jgi:outer membrane protein assembly factor BamB